MRNLILLALSALALAGCQTTAERQASKQASAQKLAATRGEQFARNRCADCHAIDYAEHSPLADAPPFAAVANTPGLTSATMAAWLKDHRNYPNEMYFEIPAEHVDDLVAYVLTLKR